MACPQAIACSIDNGRPSAREGRTKTSAAASSLLRRNGSNQPGTSMEPPIRSASRRTRSTSPSPQIAADHRLPSDGISANARRRTYTPFRSPSRPEKRIRASSFDVLATGSSGPVAQLGTTKTCRSGTFNSEMTNRLQPSPRTTTAAACPNNERSSARMSRCEDRYLDRAVVRATIKVVIDTDADRTGLSCWIEQVS